MTAPSEIDLALYEPEFDHALCQTEADLYGTAYCLATRKPGPCLGQHRSGTVLAPPTPVKIPAVPVAPTKNPGIDAGLQQAYVRAQQVATGAGLPGRLHGQVAGAMHDYAHALHGHQQAEAHAQAAYQRAQGAHDSAVARQAAQTAAYQARQAAAQAKAKAHTAHANLRHAARHKAGLAVPAGFATDLYGIPLDFELYGLVSWAHHACEVGEFCRNPLHPGPCKGWKHMLHSVAPGAYHAYEQQRVAKLNEKRVAKIKALQELGHPVPKHLLKPHTYLQVPKAPEGTPFTAPTPKEAVSKLPATAKEIGEKIGMKHAALAEASKAAKVDAAHQALANVAEALAPGSAMAKMAGGQVVKGKISTAMGELAPGQKLSEHTKIKNTINQLAEMASKAAGGLSAKDKASVAQDIAAHVDQGIPEVPPTVTSAINLGKSKEAESHAKLGGVAAPKAAPKPAGLSEADKAKLAETAKKILATPNSSLTSKAAFLSKDGFDALPKAQRDKLIADLKNVEADAGPDVSAKATALIEKFTGEKPKVTGPLVHPDMMKALDLAGFDAYASPSKMIAALQAPGVTKAEYDKLPPAAQDKIKAAVAKMWDYSPPNAQLVAHELGLGHPALLEHAATAPMGKLTKVGAAPVYNQVQQKLVAALASGNAHNVPTHFMHNYTDHMTVHDVAGLSDEHKAQLHATLTKIADTPSNGPAAQEAKSLLSGWSAAFGGAKVSGTVTPAAPLPHDAAPHAAPLPHDAAPHVKAAQSLATGAVSGTAKTKVAAYEKLSQEEYHSLPLHVQDKINIDLHTAHAKFLDPKKKQAVQDVLNKLGTPTASPHGAGAPHGTSVHASEAEKYVKGWDAAKKLANGSGLPDHKATLESVQNYAALGQMTAHEQQVTGGLAQQWADVHLTHLPLSPHEKDAIKAKAKAEMSQMLHSGATKPPEGGVLAHMKTVQDLGLADTPQGANDVASILKTKAGVPPPPPTGAGAGGPAVGAPKTKGTAGTLGKGKTLTGISVAHQQEILGAFKMQPAGAQLAHPVEENFNNALNVAHALSGQPGFGKLSLLQVLKAVDAQHSKNLGVTNANMLEKKVTDWLGTAEGAAYAKSAKPDAAVVKSLTQGVSLPTGVKLAKGAKVQAVGGPGKYDSSVPSSAFKVHTVDEARKEQAAYMAKTGEHWTPEQSDALETYTYASGPMNNYLRGTSSADAATKQKVIDAQAGMRPLTTAHLLTRGTGWEQLPEGFRDSLSAKKLIGKTISDPAFLSTSVDNGGFSGPLKLKIEAPPGTMAAFIEDISHFGGGSEKEMLLAAGTKMRVLSVEQVGGETIMRVRVVS